MKFRRQHSYISDSLPGKPQWLTTFNDLMTLLMVFFVLLFSLGNPDTRHFQDFQNALQSAMGVLNAGQGASQGIIVQDENQAANMHDPDQNNTSVSDIERFIAVEGLEAEYTSRGIRLFLDEHLLFPSGSAQLSQNGLAMLAEIGSVIMPMKRFIRVEGHSDERPIATPRYPSNWELSTARAISVIDFFINNQGFDPSVFSAAGYGASRPREENNTPENRSKNRRVEIILTRPTPESSHPAHLEHGGE